MDYTVYKPKTELNAIAYNRNHKNFIGGFYMSLNYILLGQRIRNIRKKKGITQLSLAERIDRSASYMSYIENGVKSLSLDTLILIANELNVSTDDILKDSLTNTIKVSNHEFADLTADCSEYELRILLDIVRTAKHSLREHRHLFRSKGK